MKEIFLQNLDKSQKKKLIKKKLKIEYKIFSPTKKSSKRKRIYRKYKKSLRKYRKNANRKMLKIKFDRLDYQGTCSKQYQCI